MINVKQSKVIKCCIRLSVYILVSCVCTVSLHAANKGKKGKQAAVVVQQPSKSTGVDGQLSVADVIGQAARDRQELKALRSKYMQEYTQQGEMQGNCMQLVGNITQDTIAYINQRIAETVKKLGPAPTKFSVFSMGSMARDESGFFTDLEVGILIAKKDPKVLAYFKRFSQVLADRFFLLGEHPDVGGKGLRFDEEDNGPDHLKWHARYASPEQVAVLNDLVGGERTSQSSAEGSRIFVATPQEFAQLLEPNAADKLVGATEREKEVASGVWNLVRNIRHVYGDIAVFNDYMRLRENYLQGKPQYDNPLYTNRRQEIAIWKLQDDVRKHSKPTSAIFMGKLGDTIDPKRTLYRWPEQLLTSLGFFYKADVQNTAQIADKLVAMGRMSPEWGNALKDLMNFTLCLRLRKQMKLGKQLGLFGIPVTQKGYLEIKKKFATELAIATKSLQTATAAQDTKAIVQAEDAILHAKVNIKDLDKLIPGKPDSIISPEIIMAINNKYLPIEKKLLETTQKFLEGDVNAFLGTDVYDVVKPVTPVKPVVPAKPVVPVKPVPVKPVVPAKPVPAKPVAPVKPAVPAKPSDQNVNKKKLIWQ